MPQQRQNLEAQLAASAAALNALKSKGQHLEMDRKKLELEAGTRMESINRLRTQQYETRKNEEFRAMGNEIERYEKEIRAIEDQELDLMEQVDNLKAEVAIEEAKTASGRDSIGRQMTDLETKTQTLEARLQELTKNRAELA